MGTSETLRSVIDAGRSSKRLDELSSARVIGKIALQIHAAQQKAGAGKAVGPVTPAHIMLAPGGEATLQLGEASALGYSSPEQTMGGFGDRRSDVFSLGTVLWEALTHQRLFEAMNDAAVRMAVQEREIQPPSEINANVPAELSAICMRALHRNPTDRYQSLKAMAVEIEEFLDEAGYTDDDTKIASYLAAMHAPPKAVKIDPAMLGEPPRAKSNSGAALAAALANAGATPATSNGATTASATSKSSTDVGLPAPATTLPAHAKPIASATPAASGTPAASAPLPPASFAATAIGVPKLDEWQDAAGAAAHAPPPAAAPVVPVAATSTAESTPLTPLPPVLPSGSTPLRNDKSTISVSVPPQVKVTTVDAKHTEAKQPAMLVDKPPAVIVEDKPKAVIVEDKPRANDTKQALVDDGKTTLVDGRPPEIEVPKLVNGRLPDMPPGATADGVKAEAAKVEAAKADEKPAPLPSQVETVAVKPVRPPSQSETTKRAPSQSDAAVKTRAPSQAEKSQPHPVAAVSLGPGPKEKDVLAGWGWGTDKHNAIAPDGYVGDDDFEVPTHDSRKMLLKIIGGGMALVTLIIIVAFAFGGSSEKKKETSAAALDPTKPAIDQQRAHIPDPPPAPAGSAELAAAQPAPAQPTEEEKAAAAKAAADAEAARVAEEQRLAEETKKTEAERVAAEQKQAEEAKKAEAERIAAEKKQADETKKAEAARIAAEKKQADETKKAEAARIAAEKKHADEAKKAEAARVAAEKRKAEQAKKQEAARIAAEKKAEQQRLAQAKKAEAAKTTKTTTTKTTTTKTTARKTETKVATAETKSSGKLDAETAYRQGLQQFARGDTSAALASLRTSLAANPNYGPTWRGLGLVFEKMGEKDQARAAYKRYLQLAPGAGDAEQIRSRLERLGS